MPRGSFSRSLNRFIDHAETFENLSITEPSVRSLNTNRIIEKLRALFLFSHVSVCASSSYEGGKCEARIKTKEGE